MANIFVVSDTHFNHEGIIHFERPDGTPMRPFANKDEMNEFMIQEWNKVVRPADKVYHLGDVAQKRKDIAAFVTRCNGHKRLVRGNHDIYKTKDYLTFFDEKRKVNLTVFEEIYGVRVFDDLIFSHIPLHPDSIKPQWTNVHGHLHANSGMTAQKPKYLNVCVEHTEYRPLAIEEIRQIIRSW